MTGNVLAMSAELATELAKFDTRTVRIRNSHMKAMGKSAAHCRWAIEHSNDPSLSLRLGSGVHSLTLGGPPVLLCPTKQRRGKDYDAWLEKQPTDAIVLTKKEYDRAHRVAESIRTNRHASQIIFAPGSTYEKTIEWDWLGRSRRCTPDVHSGAHLAELKTTRDGSADRFKWDVLRYGYHAQLADYAEALKTSTGFSKRDIYIVACETMPPYVVSVYRLTPGDIEKGAKLNHIWMEKLLACEAADSWPGYCATIQDLDLPDPSIDELGLTFAEDVDPENDNDTGEDE